LIPGDQARRQHSGNANPRPQGEALLEGGVFRLVMGLVARPVAVFEQGQRKEKVEAYKGYGADIEGDD
jgi:hypothetical protein